MKLSMKEKKLIFSTGVIALFFGITPTANAMHIMEGYLPPSFCVAWGVICIPFLVAGYLSIKKTLSANRQSMIIIAMAAACIFVISSLKIPSVTGSCSHMTGTGLGAILLGPGAVSILGLIVLIFQALLPCSWWIDDVRCQYIFYGDRRTICFIWDLYIMQETEIKKNKLGFSLQHS